jgi:hypothetical protein
MFCHEYKKLDFQSFWVYSSEVGGRGDFRGRRHGFPPHKKQVHQMDTAFSAQNLFRTSSENARNALRIGSETTPAANLLKNCPESSSNVLSLCSEICSESAEDFSESAKELLRISSELFAQILF